MVGKDQERDYSTKVFWANEISDKILYIAFRGAVDDTKDEFVEDWMTNLDFNLIEDDVLDDTEPGECFTIYFYFFFQTKNWVEYLVFYYI